MKQDQKQKTYNLPVRWTMEGTVSIEAGSLEEALCIYKERQSKGEIPLPKEADFFGDFGIPEGGTDPEEQLAFLRECYDLED